MSRTVDRDGGDRRRTARQDRDRDAIVDRVVRSAVKATLDWFDEQATKAAPPPRPEVVDELTFSDVVRYFSDKHPNDPAVRAGALFCRPHPTGQMLFQVFLDDNDEPCADRSGVPYGRRVIARRLDPELAAKFTDTDVVIFR